MNLMNGTRRRFLKSLGFGAVFSFSCPKPYWQLESQR